jgi:hypothetical protein
MDSMCLAGRMNEISRIESGSKLSSNIIPLKKIEGKKKSCDTTMEILSLFEHIPIRSPINVEETIPNDTARKNETKLGVVAPNIIGAVADITKVTMMQCTILFIPMLKKTCQSLILLAQYAFLISPCTYLVTEPGRPI